MKIYLDDTRKPPDDTWILVRWPEEMIALLKKHGDEVKRISLDHDLGEKSGVKKERTGYDVLVWIEKEVMINLYNPPRISIHTANPVARERMMAARYSIGQKVKDNHRSC